MYIEFRQCLTIVFVVIQKVLELCVEDLQVFLYQDPFAHFGQLVMRGLV